MYNSISHLIFPGLTWWRHKWPPAAQCLNSVTWELHAKQEHLLRHPQKCPGLSLISSGVVHTSLRAIVCNCPVLSRRNGFKVNKNGWVAHSKSEVLLSRGKGLGAGQRKARSNSWFFQLASLDWARAEIHICKYKLMVLYNKCMFVLSFYYVDPSLWLSKIGFPK